jgi:hypothetical protein
MRPRRSLHAFDSQEIGQQREEHLPCLGGFGRRTLDLCCERKRRHREALRPHFYSKPNVAEHWEPNVGNWLWRRKVRLEKAFLTNLASSWNRLANQTDRYVEFLKNLGNEK